MTGMVDGNLKATAFPGGVSNTEVLAKANLSKHLVNKVAVVRFKYSDGTTETDTGFDLPANALVREVFGNVLTAEATGTTKTVDVGLLSSESGGDADGFVVGLVVSATGTVSPTNTNTTGANNTYLSATKHGVLLADRILGEDVAAGGDGYVSRKPFHTSSVTAKSISITPASNNFAELVLDVYIVYDVLEQVEGN